jgi:hypothetical protein
MMQSVAYEWLTELSDDIGARVTGSRLKSVFQIRRSDDDSASDIKKGVAWTS